jgi:hypothetical protein
MNKARTIKNKPIRKDNRKDKKKSKKALKMSGLPSR